MKDKELDEILNNSRHKPNYQPVVGGLIIPNADRDSRISDLEKRVSELEKILKEREGSK